MKPFCYPLKAVVGVVFHQMPYTKRGQGQNVLELQCGHSKTQKTSIPVPASARCRDCWDAKVAAL